MIVSVRNNILPNFVDCNTSQAVELALSIAITAKAEPMLTLLIENLNTVIGRISHNDTIVGTHGNASRPGKKAGLGASGPKSHQQVLLVQILVDGIVNLVLLVAVGLFRPVLVLQVPRPGAEVVVV